MNAKLFPKTALALKGQHVETLSITCEPDKSLPILL
jgi:hypothetical protein